MELSQHDLDFIRANSRAAMVTVGKGGNAKVSRVRIALVDGGELDEEAFLEKMVEEGRIIYEFDVQRAYGLR